MKRPVNNYIIMKSILFTILHVCHHSMKFLSLLTTANCTLAEYTDHPVCVNPDSETLNVTIVVIACVATASAAVLLCVCCSVCTAVILRRRKNSGYDHRYNTYVTGLETRHVRSQYTVLYCTLARRPARALRVAFLRWFGLNCLWDSIYKNGGLGNEACLY